MDVIELNKSVDEFIRFLNFAYSFYKKTNTLFYISDKDYFINIIVNSDKELTINHFDKKQFDEKTEDYDYDLYFDITERLLVKLYKEGVGVKEIFSHVRSGEIKTNNFGIFKFYNFMKNFDFSPDKWNSFVKFSKSNK